MANTYCTATNTGKGFFTHQDRNDFYLSGHPGDVWVVGNNNAGVSWINRVSGTAKTKADAQTIVDGKMDEAIAAFDALSAEEQALRSRPVKYTLPQDLTMAEYKGIKGFKTQSLASDPSPGIEGQLWYNTASNVLKYTTQATAWAAAGALNTARAYTAGCGTTTAALAAGGNTPGNVRSDTAETYDGTSWTAVTSLGSARYAPGVVGSTTAAIIFGGKLAPPGGSTGQTETYNGSAWTEVADLNLARMSPGPIGQVNTAALAVSGGYGDPPQGQTETWDGTSWAAGNSLNTPRTLARAAAGTTTAGIAVSGDTNPPATGRTSKVTEEYNGTTWSNVNDCQNIRYEAACTGAVQTAALLFGGATPGSLVPQTEVYDGTSWANTSSSLATARRAVGNNSGAASTAALCIGGNPGYLANVEEYSLAPASKTVTVS